MGQPGQLHHVMLAPGAIIHLGEHKHGNAVIKSGCHIFRCRGFQIVPLIQSAKPRQQSLGNIKVRWEITGVR